MMRALIAFALLVPAPALAQDWYRVVQAGDTTWYVDAGSIVKNGQWTKVRKIGIYDAPEDGTKSVQFDAEYDCAARTQRVIHFTSFDSARNVRSSLASPDGGQLHPMKPGSAFAMLGDFVCNVDRADAVRVADPYQDKP